ncbi:hypothetical protein OPT61_g7650 [Boeremia exigua]|uniref:Uncharacterized protein n=1 Tax=Boeremia exigua TaxID=749465 RepID=A0ACC2I1T3_9PLEO|nr:hypothetical protein OPT61_g7650 [Boeremia exigua]
MVYEASAADPIELVQPRNRQLASFPQLHDSEFEEACSALLKKFELHANGQNEWSAVETVFQSETAFLRITKPLVSHPVVSDTGNNAEETELDEEDDEVAQTATSIRPVIRYEIGLSPSYRVPVLYFTIADSQHRYPPTMDTLYSHIIPPTFRAQAEHVGIIGGITVTVPTNNPVFFIHPCRTAEVMEACVSGRIPTASDYLLIWIGAMGKCVGLNVPVRLVNSGLRHD